MNKTEKDKWIESHREQYSMRLCSKELKIQQSDRSNIMKTLSLMKKELESFGHRVAYISLYGSQNYGLDLNIKDGYHSDIDAKAVIFPTLDSLISNSTPFSRVYEIENVGQVDCKDIRKFFETVLKANPAYIETLYTDYFIIDDDFKEEMTKILSLKDILLECLEPQLIRAIYGMMMEKYHAMCHPYPSIIEKVEKYGYCYSEKTMFLTENGWKFYEEINDNIRLATMNPETKELEFQFPTNRVKYKNKDGYLYDFENNDTHFCVTENHEVFHSFIYKINTYGQKYQENRSRWEKNTVKDFISGRYNNHVFNFPINKNTEYPIDDEFLELIGLYVSDGTINFSKNKIKCLRITQKKENPLFYQKMDNIMKKYGGNKYNLSETIWTFNKNIAQYIYNFCGYGSANVCLPYFIYKLSQRQANVLLDALMLGDGTDKIKNEKRRIYYTTSNKLANDIVSLGYISNKKTNIMGSYVSENHYGSNPVFQISVKEKENIPSYIHSKSHCKKTKYNGDVVCFTVPNGLLVTMLNGKPAVQSNCGKQTSHCIRLYKFLEDMCIYDTPLKECFYPTGDAKKLIIEHKLNIPKLEIATEHAEYFVREGQKIKDLYFLEEKELDFSVKYEILNLTKRMMRKKIEKEILQKNFSL